MYGVALLALFELLLLYKVNACGGKSASGDDETVGLDFVNNVCGEGHARLARQRGVLIEVYAYSRVELCPARSFTQGNLRITCSLRYFAYRYGDDIALYSLLKAVGRDLYAALPVVGDGLRATPQVCFNVNCRRSHA